MKEKNQKQASEQKLLAQQGIEIMNGVENAARIVAHDEQAAVFVYENGIVKVYPHSLLHLDITPELHREYDPGLQTSLAELQGRLLVSDLGYMRFEPQQQTQSDSAPGNDTPPTAGIPARGRHVVRVKVAETACGIVREGAEDFTLYMRAPKVMLQALGVSPETYFEAEIYKLLEQMAINRDFRIKPQAVDSTSQQNLRGARRRDSRGRFVKTEK